MRCGVAGPQGKAGCSLEGTDVVLGVFAGAAAWLIKWDWALTVTKPRSPFSIVVSTPDCGSGDPCSTQGRDMAEYIFFC